MLPTMHVGETEEMKVTYSVVPWTEISLQGLDHKAQAIITPHSKDRVFLLVMHAGGDNKLVINVAIDELIQLGKFLEENVAAD